MRDVPRGCLLVFSLFAALAVWVGVASAQDEGLVISLTDADLTFVGEEDGDWAGYFASPAGDVNGDGLGDLLVGAPMAGEKVCPVPPLPDGTCPPPAIPKGQGVAYLVLGRLEGGWLPGPVNLADADASFLGCAVGTMTARQLYTAGDVNDDGYDDFLVSGWKCGDSYTGKAYLFLGRPDVEAWGRYFPVEEADASFLGEDQWDFLSYYVSTAGDIDADGFDDFLISSTQFEWNTPCEPGTPESDCGDCCRNALNSTERLDTSSLLTTTSTLAGKMNAPRMNHTATTLADGRLLVAGGQNPLRYLPTAEILDPATGTWTLTDRMSQARSDHVAVFLEDGKVLIAGGRNEHGALLSTEVYEPTTETWTSAGDLNTARSGHAAVRLLDGRVLAIGGQNISGFVAVTEILDPDTGAWTIAGSLNVGRRGHTASLLPNGTVLVAGGHNDAGFLDSVEIFDPATLTWAPGTSMQTARDGHTAVMLSTGRLLVAGGEGPAGFLTSAEIYDPSTGLWAATGAMKYSRRDHTAALLPDGTTVVVGGYSHGGAEQRLESFDWNMGAWTWAITRTLTIARSDHTLNFLPDGSSLIVGGRSCTNFGKVYLLMGRDPADWGTDFDLALADASFHGEASQDRIGRSVTGVGDVNGDGYDDFVIGSVSSDYGGVDAGQNYLFLGRARPGQPSYDPQWPWWGNNYSVSAADASFVGEAPGDESGRRVAGAGDVNGDGLDDILVGAARNDYVGPWSGITHLILGRQAADWGMRYPLAQADGSFVGEAAHDQAGRRLSGAGDVNNDGYDDFVIGAPKNQRVSDVQGGTAGAAYLLFGRDAADWGRYYSLTQSDVIYVGKPDVGVAGYDEGWLADLNGDGIDDFFIAAYGGRDDIDVPGEVYVLFGSDVPATLAFDPSAPEGVVGEWVDFDTTFWEPNGWQDLAWAQMVLGRDVDDPKGLYVRYEPANNLLYLRDVAVGQWAGSCFPGEPVKLTNGIVQLDCGKSKAQRGPSGQLAVTWHARWLVPVGLWTDLDAYLRAQDMDAHDSDWQPFGSWPLRGSDLAISKTVTPSPWVFPGNPLTYTLSFGNYGDITASKVVITDVVPGELLDLRFVSNIPITSVGSMPYTWLVGDLAPMQEGTITLTAVMDPAMAGGLVITNSATISSDPQGVGRDNSSSVGVKVGWPVYLPLVVR